MDYNGAEQSFIEVVICSRRRSPQTARALILDIRSNVLVCTQLKRASLWVGTASHRVFFCRSMVTYRKLTCIYRVVCCTRPPATSAGAVSLPANHEGLVLLRGKMTAASAVAGDATDVYVTIRRSDKPVGELALAR